MRFVLVRDGVPELDCSLRSDDPAELRVALRARIAAWQNLWSTAPSDLGLVAVGVEPDWQDALQPLIDPDRGECWESALARRWAEPSDQAPGRTSVLSPAVERLPWRHAEEER